MRFAASISAICLGAAAAMAMPPPNAWAAEPYGSGAASPDVSADLVESFRSLCWKHFETPFKALTDAESQSWMAAPDALIDQLKGGSNDSLNDVGVRLKSRREGMLLLLVAHGGLPGGGSDPFGTATVCVVGLVGGKAPTVRAQVEQWLGAREGVESGQDVYYVFSDDAGGRRFRHSIDDASVKPEFFAGKLKAIAFHTDASSTMVGMLLPNR